MVRIWAVFLLLVMVLPVAGSAQNETATPVFALIEKFDHIAARPLWPGFDPLHTPIELFDGTNTYLYRHPAPPKEFTPVKGHPGVYVFPGRHSTVAADTAADLAGVLTATMIFHAADEASAAVLAHECFHVFQARQHPSWTANEVSLFTYPNTNPENLALMRLEMEAMRRALAAATPECWAARVRAIRSERFALLPPDAIAYERGTELHEGLAQYIQDLARGQQKWESRTFGPEEVRLRGYASGDGLARVLDRVNPNWKSRIGNSLDELLPTSDSAACAFTDMETNAAKEQALSDVKALQDQKGQLQAAFDAQPGWRVIVVSAKDKPLLLDAFDPMNISALSSDTILHKRWLKLHNASGSLEIMNHGSVTRGVGAHPLFTGIATWKTAGLSGQPEVKQDGSKVTLSSPVLNASFSNANLETNENSQTITIRLQ